MKLFKLNIRKRTISFALLPIMLGLMINIGTANAGTPCIPYTGSTTMAATSPVFNVFCGSMPAPAPLDGEQDFLQARVPQNGNLNDPTTPFTDPVNTACTNGEIVQLHVYIHNGANAADNDNGTGPSVMHNAKVAVAIPSNTSTTLIPKATLSANNVASDTDTVNIHCTNSQAVSMQYIAGSASQYSADSGVSALSDSIVTTGALIHSETVPGDLWACWQERVYVVLAVKLVVPPPKPTPQVTATCNMFSVLANTDRVVTVNTFKYTNINATVKSVVINWGDGNNTTVTNANNVIGQSHTYSEAGDYNLDALITFMNNTGTGPETITSGGPNSNCAVAVNIPTNNTPPTVIPVTPVTPVTPPTAPTSLVNTGPGSVIALFAAVSTFSAVAYRWFLSRRTIS